MKLPKRQVAALHCHTEYSLLDGCLNASKFIEAAREKKIDSLAITEHGNMASAMGFYLDAIKEGSGVKPVFGIEAYIVKDLANLKDEENKSSHIVLIAIDNDGFTNLLKLSSISWVEGFYYKPKIDVKALREHSGGLVALSACLGGVLANEIRHRGYESALKKAKFYDKMFNGRFYLEMQVNDVVYAPDLNKVRGEVNSLKNINNEERIQLLNNMKGDVIDVLTRNLSTMELQDDYEGIMRQILGDNWLDQATLNKYLYKIHKETGIKYVVTGDAHYPRKGDHVLQDVVIRVGFGDYKKARQGADDKAASTGRGYYSKELYLKDNKDFDDSRKKFHPYMPRSVLVKAILNTHKIADSTHASIDIGHHQLPVFPIKSHIEYEKKMTKEDLFRKLVEIGWEKLIVPKIAKSQVKFYRKRLEFEFKTIKDANFVDYFLIIEDIVRWSRKHGIHCVARGSVAGSLVAYAIDITGIDPIEYNLLFERFLNPTRVSGERAKSADALPDIDLDFERNGRARVKKYIVKKYGADRVCTIGSYGTMGVKTLVKDVARVFEYQIEDDTYDYVSINKITSSVEIAKTIEEACESSDEFRKFHDKHKKWFDKFIRPLQSEIRSMSRHAAGVLVTPTPYVNWVPIRTQTLEEEGKVVISQWEDVYCERRGLLKLDILGVKQLDVFHRCIELIKKFHGVDINLSDIDVNDVKVFKKFHQGDNFGVFQFNSQLQSGYMRRMKPNSVEDLCASNALLRPGPMQENAHEMFIQLREGSRKPEYDHECVIPYVENTMGLMIYQEQIMQVANVLGGLTLADADVMRSTIKKKDEAKMASFKDRFIEGCRAKGLTSSHAEKVWHKIIAFSSYGFNKSHSATYALQGYYCQWLKTYYPTAFYAATLDFASDDVNKNENIYTHRYHAMTQGIKFTSPNINGAIDRFGISKKGAIEWPATAVKGVGDKAGVAIRAAQPFKSFEDFYARIDKRVVNKRVVVKLIVAGAFSKFGKVQSLLEEYFALKKEKLPEEFTDIGSVGVIRLRDSALGYISKSYKEAFANKFSSKIMSYDEYKQRRLGQKVIVGGLVTKFHEHKARNGMMAFMTIEDLNEQHEIVIFNSVWAKMRSGEKPAIGNIVEVRGSKGKSLRGDTSIIMGDTSDKFYILA